MKIGLFVLAALCISLNSFGQYGSTDTLSYASKYFKDRRILKISLPEEYADNPNRSYQVIYLFDAQSEALYNFTKATLSFFPGYASFYFDPVILVGIETKNRHFEFLPKHINTAPGPKNYAQAGGADTLALSIENELKPLIEKKYRTNGYAIGIGHSLGGTFVTYTMLKYPKIFNAGICISPNYVFDNEAILKTLSNPKNKNFLSSKFLYIAYGNTDEMEENFRKSTMKFGELLKKSKIPSLFYKIDPLNNTSHSTTPMEGIFKGLIFINDFMNLPYEKYKSFLSDTSKQNFVDYVKQYFKTKSSQTGLLLPSVGELNLIAYNAFYPGKKNEAIQILEWAISLYPDDPNLFDSMGEIQEKSGNIDKAEYYYQKGLSIAESQKAELSETTYKSKIDWFQKRLAKLEKK
ncbi:MAG: alpha/beta hydrolase-fold protein [Agriterribacter sp.]